MANVNLVFLVALVLTILAEIILIPLFILSPFIFLLGILLAGPPFLYAAVHPYWFEEYGL